MFHPFEKTGDISRDIDSLTSAMEALADRDILATLANAASLLNWYLDDINWVGFYLWNEGDGELVLGPFQGLPACIRIAPGRGVCGAAVETGEIQVVADVREFPGHIACDAASLSELVVPMFRADGSLLGVLDIDSPRTGRFRGDDGEAFGGFCRRLSELITG